MINLHDNTLKEIAKFICGYDRTNYPILRDQTELMTFFSSVGINFYDPMIKLTASLLIKSDMYNVDYIEAVFLLLKNNKLKVERIILALADPRLYRDDKKTFQAIKVLNEILQFEKLEIRLINGIAEIIKLNKETILSENHELMFNILLELEGDIKIDLSEYSNDEINFTKELLIHKKLAEGTIIDGEGGHKFIVDLSLTPSGHEYLLAQKNKKKYNLPYTIGDNIYESNESIQIKKIKEEKVENSQIKIFISHSSIDKDIMEIFVDLITNVFDNLKRKEIICTSVKGCKIEYGKDIYDEIKKSSSNSLFILGMFSHNLIKSSISLFEIGIGWANDKLLSIIIDESFNFMDLPKAIESRTTKKIFEKDDINEILDHLRDKYGFLIVDSNVRNQKIEEFLMKYSNIPKPIYLQTQNNLKSHDFENEWQKEKKYFDDNKYLFKHFDLLFKDIASKDWSNFQEYKNDLPLIISLNLYEEINDRQIITEKGKYFYKKLFEEGFAFY